ncbi:MAG: type III-B CRISPR module-associated protein Cmr5 [candidate division WOR-3 bacterium]|nr:type III-B CRISPR module-associated protein Cmr5 [candidate division WOR-3 bacterium]
MNLITKLEKGRAEFAYRCVEEAIQNLSEIKKQKEYRSYVRKIPQMIISNGLGQTLAFVFAKKKNGNAYDLIYRQITDYLKSDATARIRMPNNQNELIKWVISLNSYEYRHVTEEILAFLNWLRRFAEGMIETEEEE